MSNLFAFFMNRLLHTKIWRKKYINKYTLKKRLKRKSFIHLFAVYAFKKHLRERKPLIFLPLFQKHLKRSLFDVLCFFMSQSHLFDVLCFFIRESHLCFFMSESHLFDVICFFMSESHLFDVFWFFISESDLFAFYAFLCV